MQNSWHLALNGIAHPAQLVRPVEVESPVVAISVMTTLCVVGVAFYLRFLVALLNEHKRHPNCYLVCLRAGYVEHALPNDEPFAPSVSSAA